MKTSFKSILLKLSLALILITSAFATGKYVINNWFSSPGVDQTCYDGRRNLRIDDASERELYKACREKLANLYISKDYAESKDLGKTFLTLLSAILVASITFSEKIVDVTKSGLTPLSTMVVCWVLLLAAIVCCGTGIALMTTAAGMAAYQPELDFYRLAWRGMIMFLSAGVSFVFALLALIFAGVVSLIEKRSVSISDLQKSA